MNRSIYGVIIDYIDDNIKNGVDYEETIEYLKEVLNEIQHIYEKESE